VVELAISPDAEAWLTGRAVLMSAVNSDAVGRGAPHLRCG